MAGRVSLSFGLPSPYLDSVLETLFHQLGIERLKSLKKKGHVHIIRADRGERKGKEKGEERCSDG